MIQIGFGAVIRMNLVSYGLKLQLPVQLNLE